MTRPLPDDGSLGCAAGCFVDTLIEERTRYVVIEPGCPEHDETAPGYEPSPYDGPAEP